MSEISGFFYCAKCDKNTSFCGGSGGAKNDHNTRGNNIEWKFKDNKWSIKNKYDGWGREFKIITNFDGQNQFCWCDNCFDEKPSFTDFIRDYPSIIINHLVDKINQLEIENLKIKLNVKENEIQKSKIENNYLNQIKNYENEIQTLKNDNNNLINKIKLLENNSNNSIYYNNISKNDKKIISSMKEIKIEANKNNELKNKNLKEKIITLNKENDQIKELEKTINKLNIELDKIKELKQKLENDLTQKDKEIQKLLSQIKNKKDYYDISSLKPDDKIIGVNFVSMGSNDIGHYNLVGKSRDLFVRLEERLYEDFPQFKNYETYFEVNGKRIKRFQTLEQNNIKTNDIINIFIIEE